MSIAIKRNFTIPSESAIGASELYLTSSVASTTIDTGSLIVAGGAGISGVVSLGGQLKLFNGSFYTGFDSAATANTTYIWPATSPATGTSVLSSDAAGNLSWILMSASGSGSGLTLNGLTASTQYFSTSNSGSGFTISSIGSTHTFYIGLAGNASTGLISSAAQTIFGLKTFGSGVAVTSGTASTNTTTGALTVAGGVGITGQLSVNTVALGTTAVSITPSMIFTGTAGTVITMSVLSDTTLAWEGSSGQLFSIDNNLSSGEIFSVSDISGLPLITASAGQTITLNEFGGYTQVGNGLASTSTTTGALRVIGGIGVTGAVNIAGNTSISSSTSSTGFSTGALVVTGGVGVGGSSHFNNTLHITSSTASTNTTTGALIVSGGAGIGGTLNIGGNIRAGTNTFSKSGLAPGDILLDNGTVDTPGLLFYWGNNRNIGIDTFYGGTGATRIRIVKELNESGGSELWSIDRNGIITRSAWDVGEVIASRMYNFSDLNMSATTTVGVNTYVRIANLTYTPKSSSSHIWIEFSCVYEIAGAAADDFYSNITVNGTEVVYNRQIWINGAGGGTRSGALFPISARYTNSSTSGIAITVQAARGSSDDNGTFVGNSVSGFMRIMEIGR